MSALSSPAPRLFLTEIMNKRTRWAFHTMVMIAVVFLSVYATIVCPFIDGLPFYDVLLALASIGVFHVLLREIIMLTIFPKVISRRIGQQYYLSTVITWGTAGIAASVLHSQLYPDFPIESHLKLLVGYWALGGGFIATFETHRFSQLVRRRSRITLLPVSFSKQFVRLVTMFVVVPNLVLVLIVFRFAYEGYIDRGAGFELIFLMLIFGVLALTIAFVYGRELRKDTYEIVKAFRQIAKGNLNVKIDTTRPDEIGYVSSQLKGMVKDLAQKQRIESAFGRFVNPIVAKRFLEDAEKEGSVLNQGRSQHVTIMMCDIRRFTTITESMSPSLVTKMLNFYFERMINIVHKHNGIIDKFIGDAFLAIFGLLEEKDYARRPDVVSAYRCAEELFKELEFVNQDLAREKIPELDIGAGIHYGEVIAGYIGSPERLEFTIIGSNVNMASRIESVTKAPNPPLLISEQAAAHLMHLKDPPQQSVIMPLRGLSGESVLYTHPKVKRRQELTPQARQARQARQRFTNLVLTDKV